MTFRTLAASIERNAHGYRTLHACQTMARRLKRAYERAGSLGVEYSVYRDALWAIQLRAVGIQGELLDAKYEGSIDGPEEDSVCQICGPTDGATRRGVATPEG